MTPRELDGRWRDDLPSSVCSTSRELDGAGGGLGVVTSRRLDGAEGNELPNFGCRRPPEFCRVREREVADLWDFGSRVNRWSWCRGAVTGVGGKGCCSAGAVV